MSFPARARARRIRGRISAEHLHVFVCVSVVCQRLCCGCAAAVDPDVALPVRDHSKSKSTLFNPGG